MFLALILSAALGQEFTLDGSTLVLPAPVTFQAEAVDTGAASALDHVRAYLAAKTYITTMRVEAHVSGVADAQAVSERRALAVSRWLVAHGVDCKRLLPVGFGDTKPVASADTPEGRAQNTRVVFVNAALRGTWIGGLPADGGGKVAGDPCVLP